MADLDDISDDELAEIRENFDHFDQDQNGVIDREEFAKLMRAIDDQITDKEVADGLSILDSNRNGVIDYDEFIEWWAEHYR